MKDAFEVTPTGDDGKTRELITCSVSSFAARPAREDTDDLALVCVRVAVDATEECPAAKDITCCFSETKPELVAEILSRLENFRVIVLR